MTGSMTVAAFQKRIRDEIVEKPLIERLGLKPGDLNGAANGAFAAMQAGDHASAFQGFAHLVMVDPTNADFHAGLAEAALELGHHALALQSASVIVATRGGEPEGYFLSARACLGLGEPALALEDLAQTEAMAQRAGKPAYAAAAQRMRSLIGAA